MAPILDSLAAVIMISVAAATDLSIQTPEDIAFTVHQLQTVASDDDVTCKLNFSLEPEVFELKASISATLDYSASFDFILRANNDTVRIVRSEDFTLRAGESRDIVVFSLSGLTGPEALLRITDHRGIWPCMIVG